MRRRGRGRRDVELPPIQRDVRAPWCPAAWELPYQRWRKAQREAINRICAATTKYVMLQAPTGFGKSLVAAGITQARNARTATLTATKVLQHQYGRTMPHVYFDVRGMRSYPCLAAQDEFSKVFRHRRKTVMCDDGPCNSEMPCSLKASGCLYFDAVRQATEHHAPLTNYAFWLASRRYSKGLGAVPVLACDEAHDIADQLMGACRIDIPFSDMDRRRPPRGLTEWANWAHARLEALKTDEMHDGGGDSEVRMRNHKQRNRLRDLSMVTKRDWAWEKTDRGWTFEPVRPATLLPLLTDDVQQQVIFISATITLGALELLGIDPNDVTVIAYPSTFPIWNRPVYMLQTARVDVRTFAREPDVREAWLYRIAKIVRKRRHVKGIIHTVSYTRQREVVEYLLDSGVKSRHIYAPHGTQELARLLPIFRAAGPGAVLVSPSVHTGLDFPDDDARYQIITKTPFPDTRSPIMRARVQANPGYAMHHVAQTIQQMAGRIVRSETDWGETFIIDDHARWVIHEHRELYADWFLESLQWIDTIPQPLEYAA